jgi:hypothetical protein
VFCTAIAARPLLLARTAISGNVYQLRSNVLTS